MENREPAIDTGNDYPGIRSPLAYAPRTGVAVTRLVESLLRADEGLPRGERELAMAAACLTLRSFFCHRVHAHCADILLPGERVIENFRNQSREIGWTNGRLQNIVGLSEAVAGGHHPYLRAHASECRKAGLADRDVHDVILIASTACMLSSYEAALGGPYPDDDAFFRKLAQHFLQCGYLSDLARKG